MKVFKTSNSSYAVYTMSLGKSNPPTWKKVLMVFYILIYVAGASTMAYWWIKFILHGAYMFDSKEYTFKQALHEICIRFAVTIVLPIAVIKLRLPYKINARKTARLHERIVPQKSSLMKRATQEFQYSGIHGTHATRLLSIYPGLYDDDLHGTITPADLQDRHLASYTALSYTWANESGDTSLSHRIDALEGFVRITKNSDAAIRRLRH